MQGIRVITDDAHVHRAAKEVIQKTGTVFHRFGNEDVVVVLKNSVVIYRGVMGCWHVREFSAQIRQNAVTEARNTITGFCNNIIGHDGGQVSAILSDGNALKMAWKICAAFTRIWEVMLITGFITFCVKCSFTKKIAVAPFGKAQFDTAGSFFTKVK